MAKQKSIDKKDLIGVWQMAPVAGMVQSFALQASGKAEQSIKLPDGKTISQPGTWKLDGDRKWIVTLPREEVEYDIVKLNASAMECTNWDDDAIVIKFKKVK